MNDPPQNDTQELHDLLIAISVVARHLARKLEALNKEQNHEQDERPINPAD